LKILLKLHGPLSECNQKEFPNITSSVNTQLLELSSHDSFIRWLTKIANACALSCTAEQINNYDKLTCSQPITVTWFSQSCNNVKYDWFRWWTRVQKLRELLEKSMDVVMMSMYTSVAFSPKEMFHLVCGTAVHFISAGARLEQQRKSATSIYSKICTWKTVAPSINLTKHDTRLKLQITVRNPTWNK